MASNPRDVLKKLIADNPNASEGELLAVFMKPAKDDKALNEAILREVLDELGPGGVMNLLKPKNEKH